MRVLEDPFRGEPGVYSVEDLPVVVRVPVPTIQLVAGQVKQGRVARQAEDFVAARWVWEELIGPEFDGDEDTPRPLEGRIVGVHNTLDPGWVLVVVEVGESPWP